jgi:hypothetical protein
MAAPSVLPYVLVCGRLWLPSLISSTTKLGCKKNPAAMFAAGFSLYILTTLSLLVSRIVASITITIAITIAIAITIISILAGGSFRTIEQNIQSVELLLSIELLDILLECTLEYTATNHE